MYFWVHEGLKLESNMNIKQYICNSTNSATKNYCIIHGKIKL